MTKELEALEKIGNVDLGDNPYKIFEANKLKNVYSAEFTALYKALTELKTIKESKSSEALECLEEMYELSCDGRKPEYTLYETIKQYILKAQEQEKVMNELLMLINDLEPTFNRKGVSNDIAILGTIFKDYFIDNASVLLKRYLENEHR